uniref:EF-hand and coiled-coil domain containing 1 n=1 Tax=Anas platyrhynchos platyrhynchos TaxID=8840 RepID=U3J2Q4_ANAPP
MCFYSGRCSGLPSLLYFLPPSPLHPLPSNPHTFALPLRSQTSGSATTKGEKQSHFSAAVRNEYKSLQEPQQQQGRVALGEPQRSHFENFVEAEAPPDATEPPPPVPQRPRGSAPTVTPGPGAPRQPPQGGQRRERPEGGGGGPGPGRAGCGRVPVSLRSGAFRCLLLTGVRALWPGPSRDGQIEEAIRFNQELERELKSSQEALVNLEDCNRNLKREQAEMRKKVEEARHAVLNSLGKVKELEVKANEVPHLQIYIQQLESELQHYSSGAPGSENSCSKFPPPPPPDDQLFRSVEGQAASDEEEEKWAGDQQSQAAQVKKILAKLPCCGSGCDEKLQKKLMSYLEITDADGSETAPAELEERISQLTEQLELKGHEVKKLETNMEEVTGQKVEETEMLKMELQMLETERVRLSLVEEKLMDVLQLLQQLRDLNISKRALGKILLSTLESCRDPQHGKAHLFEVLDTLYQELTACELLQSQPLEKAQSCQSLSNPLVISC